MEIAISTVLQSPRDINQHPFNERLELPGEDETLLEPVTGELVVTRTSNRILQVGGEFHTRLRLSCDRCGNHFEFPVDFTLDETLEVVDEAPISEEVEDVVFAQGHLDATDLIRQGLLLSLPSRRLCGCEPLHQQADTGKTDPRWSALQSLMVEPNGNE